jgi:hypothetical protein
MIRINYKPIFDWWTNNGGKKYDDKFNLFAVVASNYSSSLYYLSKLVTNPLNQLEAPQIRFILGQLMPYTTYVIDSRQYGLLTPKMLCETVKLSRLDNDDFFNNWFDFFERQNLPVKEGAGLNYIPNPGVLDKKTNRMQYTYTLQLNTGDDSGYTGLYPKDLDDSGWCGLILEWLGQGWVLQTDDDKLLHPYYTGTDDNSLSSWFANKGAGRPDNFLARMGMLPTCPLVVYYCNNQYSTNGMKVDPQAFANLLSSSGDMAGGWVGFLNGMAGGNYDYDDYTNLIRTRVDDPAPPVPPQCKPPNTLNGVLAGASTTLSALAGLAFIPEAGLPAFLAIIGIAIATGTISGVQAGAGTC